MVKARRRMAKRLRRLGALHLQRPNQEPNRADGGSTSFWTHWEHFKETRNSRVPARLRPQPRPARPWKTWAPQNGDNMKIPKGRQGSRRLRAVQVVKIPRVRSVQVRVFSRRRQGGKPKEVSSRSLLPPKPTSGINFRTTVFLCCVAVLLVAIVAVVAWQLIRNRAGVPACPYGGVEIILLLAQTARESHHQSEYAWPFLLLRARQTMSDSGSYTVFGFGCSLDWKPTVFVNGVPPTRVCAACGLVPSSTATLPCRHALCRTCYDRSADKHKRCPLDKEPFLKEDVVWSSFALESLLQRKIQCWNASKGCDAVGRASDILEHFGNECLYQAATCLRCKASLIHKDVVDHLESSACRPSVVRRHVDHGNDSERPDIREALRHIEATLSSLKASVECVKSATTDSGQFRESSMLEVPLVESIQSLDNTLKENTQTCAAASTQITETRALVQCSVGAIKASIDDLRRTIRELKETQDRFVAGDNTSSTHRAACGVSVSSQEELRGVRDELRALREATSNTTKSTLQGSKVVPSLRNDVTDKLCLLVTASKAILHNTLAISKPVKLTVTDWSKLVAKASSEGPSASIC
ncbi:hypothetical protein HPB48_009108 [Haemaphysalis longicornis]|uniref:RING-type domain-containing protein n=1 Tax=Haemaphysalis longicornis TaxID=44386 RepID=A0A9J6FC69_HAELO|nr:hypothetical protein HPB48_009108 [Haemaphysalis longicornis]